ncbi:Zinc finger protein Xfin [Anthophora retusa]
MEPRERYQELCRLCASYDAVKMDIFGQEGKNRQLVDKIQACLPFKIAEDDRLPKCLCYRCMYNLENFYDFRTACVNAVALLERCLPPSELNGDVTSTLTYRNDSELFKGKGSIPVLIPEAPIVNPNAALGTPPRLNSDGEADHETEEIVDNSGTDEATIIDDSEDRHSEEYEMDMETNPSDFLEMTSMVTEEPEESELRHQELSSNLPEHTSQQHEVYVCSLCNKAFSSKGHLSLHARIHVGAGDVIGEKVLTDDHTSYKRPYQCDLCHKSYSTAKHRWGHVSTTHRGHPAVTCGYCSRIYSTRTNLEEHIKSRHAGLPAPTEVLMNNIYRPENRCQCNACGKICTDAMELNLHGRICAEGQRLDNPVKSESRDNKLVESSEASSIGSDDDGKDYRTAEAKLAKNPQLTILKQALTKGDSLKRDFEDKFTTNCKPQKLPKTENTNIQNIKKWYCESCPQSFTSIEDLKEHEAVHDADKPFICILCKKDFVLKSSLSRHIQTLHGVDPLPIVESDKCLKKIVSQNWNESMEIDLYEGKTSSEFPLSPEINAENEDDPESGQENLIEIETVFVCEICTRDFNDRASLWLHIRATHKEFAAFACGVCLKICADNTQLLNHVNMYHGGSKLLLSEQRRYSCTICGRQHDSRKKLIAHVSIHNVDPNYDPATFVQLNSNYYGENINGNETAEQMFDYEEDGDKVDCYICYKSFPNEDHLIRHQRNAHRSEQLVPTGDSLNSSSLNGGGNRAQYHLFFVCELCGSSHPSKWERWLHVSSSHSNEPAIKCDREDCGKIFATKSLRNEHVQHHAIQGSSPNTCEICGKLWGSRVDYWKHVMGVHSDTVPLICGVCLKVFPNVLQLSTHVKSKHWPLTNGDFSCDICGRPYSNKSKMSRHRKIHGFEESCDNGAENNENKVDGRTRETELSCELCADLMFTSLEKLCNHRRIVHGLFPCDLCNKCYGRTSHLWKHVNRVHKGHEDVTCPYCLKTSASKDHLAAHISKIHRYEPDSRKDGKDNRQFKTEEVSLHYCEKCNKGFHKRYLLRRHMKGCQNYRKDPGALLTRCRACERIFKDRASLQKHIENHHSTYTCHLCNETITSKLGIMTHNRVKHMDHPDLTCNFGSCKKLFRTKEDLEAHKKDHRYHTTPNVCDFCGDTVENKLKLKMHVLSLHRNEIGVSCGVCLIPMKDPKELKGHVEEVHSGVLSRPNTCQVCGKQYASKWKAFDHTKKCHGKVFRTCKQCLAVFTEDSAIRDHYETVHNIPKDQLAAFEYRLDIRSKNEDFEVGSPDVIVKEEPEDLEYDVDICDEDSSDSKRRRSLTDTFDCEMCPEMFVNSDALSKHYRNMHNTDPERMFKRLKQDEQRRMRGKMNFFCKNCKRQFCTKTLYWNHVANCRRNIMRKEEELLPLQTDVLSNREELLKNNNQIKKEEPTSNLNIPDFNLFEDINLQLSGQRPLPNLMPLSQRTKSSIKCSRKDSRKVYDESTNTECACEVCGKQWPAKKHLWQHLIRFHRAEAAVTCGVCLKLCKDYDDLAIHLKAAHEAILSCEGNNFTCKTCGRYHNARSKLLLHTSIHIGHAGNSTWCPKCRKNITDEASHANTCLGKTEDEEPLKNNEKVEERLIADDTMIEEVEGDFESEAEEGDTEESESGSSTEVEEENESEGESRATEEITYNSESEDSEDLNLEIDEKSMQRYTLEHLQETKNAETVKNTDVSDDDGPPVLSPIMPLLPENMSVEQSLGHKLVSIVSLSGKEMQMRNLSEIRNQSSPKSVNLYEKRLSNNESLDFESETFINRSDEDFEDTKNEFDENSIEENEDNEEIEENESENEENVETEHEGTRFLKKGNENGEVEEIEENYGIELNEEMEENNEDIEEENEEHGELEENENIGEIEDTEENEGNEDIEEVSDNKDNEENSETGEHEENYEIDDNENNEGIEEVEENEENEEFEGTLENERNEEIDQVNVNKSLDEIDEMDEHEGNDDIEETEESEGNEETEEREDNMQLDDLEGAVLMVTEGDQILIQQGILEDENENSSQEYVYSTFTYSTEDSDDARK